MRRPSFRLFIPLLILAVFIPFIPQGTSAFDQDVYNNLMRSHDALSSQQTDLQNEYDATQKQIDALESKLSRIDSYLKQITSSLRDVDTALVYAKK